MITFLLLIFNIYLDDKLDLIYLNKYIYVYIRIYIYIYYKLRSHIATLQQKSRRTKSPGVNTTAKFAAK